MASQSDQDWQSTKKTVLERNCYMFNNPSMSDVVFTCGESEKKFYAHKYVLATSSAVFYAMFYGDLAETNSVIRLPDTDEESFEEFLRFLYTDKCILTPDSSFKVMYLAKKYLLPSLTEKCVAVIQSNMKPENVVTALDQAIQFGEVEMETKCWQMIDLETSKAVASDAFNQISQVTLINLLKQETLNIKEIELFQAVLKWSDWHCKKNGLEATGENKRSVLGDAIYQIDFLSMSQKEFAQYVSSSGVLTDHEIVPIYDEFNGSDVPDSKWKISHRQPKILRVTLSSGLYLEKRYNEGAAHCLSFSVNKPVTFHGVRLFGGRNCSKHEVTLEVNGAKVSGTYTSEREGAWTWVSGFDVMLSKPIPVDANKIITMVATITMVAKMVNKEQDLNEYGADNGRGSVMVNGVTVTFIPGSGSGKPDETTAKSRKFDKILFSV